MRNLTVKEKRKIAIAALCGLVFMLTLQNTQLMTVHFLFWKVSLSKIVWMLLMVIVGFALGYLTER